ncbi:MAG: UDP-glucose:(heptosyl)LPS alpha-1,3-glucosyltransferase [Parasphingorhabdus sp.]|jgi:UDP-glucose:(heptosyl)LPS alpha-1,3-glucosyltransferase
MKLAFCLFKYFPYSGLSRDFLRILLEAKKRGHDPHVFVAQWQGEQPTDIPINVIPAFRWMNHAQNASFHRQLKKRIKDDSFDAVIGFNKMPDMDIYYGADFCYIGRAVPRYSPLYRLTPRFHHFYTFERAVFSAQKSTLILSLSEREKGVYQQFYGTPESRFQILPPTLDATRCMPEDPKSVRKTMRGTFGIGEDDFLLLFVGSGFKTKGLDRAILALKSLPDELRSRSQMLVVGQDNPQYYQRLTRSNKVQDRVHFLGGRSDIPEILASGDILLHPAYSENTGTILLEALTAGLPVLTTDVCGYAPHISQAKAGFVLRSPFDQETLNLKLHEMLLSDEKLAWSVNGKTYGDNPDLYKMPETAINLIEEWHLTHKSKPSRHVVETPEGASLYMRDDLKARLHAPSGLDDVMSIDGEVFRQAPGRRTVRLTRDNKSYFLKTHTGVGWQEIMKNLLYFRLPVLGAMNEWHGVHHLHRLGLETLNIAGYGTTSGNPATRRSFIVTDEIANSISLEDFCERWKSSPPTSVKDIRFKRWLIDRLAHISRDIHNSGANHRDYYLCHFLLQRDGDPEELSPENSRLFLIDLHRMQLRRRTPVRWAVKDISGLRYSSMDLNLTRRDIYRFLRIYRGKPLRQILSKEWLFWRRVESRAKNLYQAERRRAQLRALSDPTGIRPRSTQP